ncbi:Senescence regulator S40 [Dillenia turbinata]|uniref:Senescence regulator S40 n=1 Tax=Dillenia turbinata TaxID=194707 RepID=A0AAN8ZBQ7_9MAGN
MAKGRKLTTSRSERYLGGGYGYSNGQNVSVTDEFGEEDVWSTVDDTADCDDRSIPNGSRGEWSSRDSDSGGLRLGRRIPKGNSSSRVGGLSLAFEDSEKTPSSRVVHQYRNQDGVASPGGGMHMATSAPVNVPDWQKILRVDSVESLHDSDDDHDSEWIPPHEYLAREYARSRKMAATSVFEGVGRTLKGRDMSRVRDAVWSQTGFDG